MGVTSSRAHHKDGRASEKQEVREEKSDSESSEHGELQNRSHTRIFSVCSLVRPPDDQPNKDPADDDLSIKNENLKCHQNNSMAFY